jgi:hypothetical protein
VAKDANAERFVERLHAHRSPEQREKYRRYFKLGEGEYGEGDEFVGVRMGQVFALAKEFIEMPPDEIEKLLESPIHEVRAGGLSIMDKQARRKRTPESRRKELFDLYMRRTDRINNWDLVDVACPHVVGGYLSDKPRDALYELARSENMWERRTAIVSTYFFIRQGDVDDTFPDRRGAARRPGGPDPQGHRRLAARGGQEGPQEVEDLPRRTRRDDAAHDAPLRHRASRRRGTEALPKHEEGRVGVPRDRGGPGGARRSTRGSPRQPNFLKPPRGEVRRTSRPRNQTNSIPAATATQGV